MPVGRRSGHWACWASGCMVLALLPSQAGSAQHLALLCSLEAAALPHIPAIQCKLCMDQPPALCSSSVCVESNTCMVLCSSWECQGPWGYDTPKGPSASDKMNRGKRWENDHWTNNTLLGQDLKCVSQARGDSIETPLLLGCSCVSRAIKVPLGRDTAQFGTAKQCIELSSDKPFWPSAPITLILSPLQPPRACSTFLHTHTLSPILPQHRYKMRGEVWALPAVTRCVFL